MREAQGNTAVTLTVENVHDCVEVLLELAEVTTRGTGCPRGGRCPAISRTMFVPA